MSRQYMQDPYDRPIISARGLSGRVNHDDMLNNYARRVNARMRSEDTGHLITPRDRRPYGQVQPPRYAALERERRLYSEASFTLGRPSGGIHERERRPYAYDLSPGGPVFTERERRPYRQGSSVRDPPRRGGGGYGGRGYGGNGYHGGHGGCGGHGYGGGDYIRISHFRTWW